MGIRCGAFPLRFALNMFPLDRRFAHTRQHLSPFSIDTYIQGGTLKRVQCIFSIVITIRMLAKYYERVQRQIAIYVSKNVTALCNEIVLQKQ